MAKTDIYEYLAKVYLGSSRADLKKKNQIPPKSGLKNLFKLGILVLAAFVLAAILLATISLTKHISLKSKLALILEPNIVKIAYNLDTAKKSTATFDLRGVNLLGFKTLGFRARRSYYQENLHLRIEFISGFKEVSQFYIKQIPRQWQDFKVELSNFKEISDWSNLNELKFIVEEWNIQDKRGTVYIDNIHFLK